jgi:hypothetical protein
MITLSDAYLQMLDKRWWLFTAVGAVVVIIVVIILIGVFGGKAESRNLQRVQGSQIIYEALTKYYIAQGKYPDQLKQLVPDYVKSVPTGFTKADGTCKIGGYSYKKFSSQNTYELVFCISEKVGELEAGNHIVTPFGIR